MSITKIESFNGTESGTELSPGGPQKAAKPIEMTDHDPEAVMLSCAAMVRVEAKKTPRMKNEECFVLPHLQGTKCASWSNSFSLFA
jgi:hypothetical protein